MSWPGLSAPPQIRPGRLDNGVVTATAWPTLDDGPWQFAMVSTGASGAHYFAAGDSTVDADPATGNPWFAVKSTDYPVIVNVSGTTHYAKAGPGGGGYLVTPVNCPRGDRGMLNSPPQIGTSLAQDMTAGGNVAIPTIGTMPTKYVMLTTTAALARIAVGDSTISIADEQLFISENHGPVILNVAGQTHIAFTATAETLIIAVLAV